MQDQDPTETPLNPDPLTDIKGGADYCCTTERHMRHLISKREITVTRIGNKVRFRISDLNAYIVTRTTPAKVDQ